MTPLLEFAGGSVVNRNRPGGTDTRVNPRFRCVVAETQQMPPTTKPTRSIGATGLASLNGRLPQESADPPPLLPYIQRGPSVPQQRQRSPVRWRRWPG